MHPQSNTIPRNCEYCGKPFDALARFVRQGYGRFCSIACSNRSKSVPLVIRFWAKVKQGQPDECWPFMASRNAAGYGTIGIDGKSALANRVAWQLTNGAIPAGQYVLHKCDNPPCCNPSHLFLGTHADNALDKKIKGRARSNRGEEKNTAKLTEKQVKAIRQEYRYRSSTHGLKALSAKYGVCVSAVEAIVKHRTWRHVT